MKTASWLAAVGLAFLVPAYSNAMFLFAMGMPDLGQAFLMWTVMTPAGAIGAIVGFVPTYVVGRFLSSPKVAVAGAIALAFLVSVAAARASLSLLGGPV
jgi:hypothetical protein